MIYDLQEAEIHLSQENLAPFNIHRRVRQGCPLIFNIFIKVLAEAIRQQPEIEGIEFLGQFHKIMLYADDIVFSVASLVSSTTALNKILWNLGEIS